MVYIKQTIARHAHEVLTEDGWEIHTHFPSIRYWNGKDFGRGMGSNEEDAISVSLEEAQTIIEATIEGMDEECCLYTDYTLCDSPTVGMDEFEQLLSKGEF